MIAPTCPECTAAGVPPERISVGVSSTTAMHCSPFYDSEGRYHSHDSNRRTTSYTCSNGHRWRAEDNGSCWCGWSGA